MPHRCRGPARRPKLRLHMIVLDLLSLIEHDRASHRLRETSLGNEDNIIALTGRCADEAAGPSLRSWESEITNVGNSGTRRTGAMPPPCDRLPNGRD